MPTKRNDPVNHPSHYTEGFEHEVIELTRQLDFDIGNACKYILRAGKKNDFCEDYRKAAWYLDDAVANTERRVVDHDVVELAETYNSSFVSRIIRACFTPAKNVGNDELTQIAKELREMAHIVAKELAAANMVRAPWPNIPASRREMDLFWDVWS